MAQEPETQSSRASGGAAEPRSGGMLVLVQRIQDSYVTLSPNERKLAELLLDFPHHLVTHSATELTERAGVSKSAGTRFFRRLGFESYDEARRLVREAQDWGSPLYLGDPARNGVGGAGLEGYLQREITNLTRSVEAIPTDRLAEIAQALASARGVVIAGWRNSHMMGSYFRWQLIQLRERVSLLNRSGETAAEHLAGLGPEDLLVIVGVRRRPRALETLFRAAEATGVRILLIADRSAGALGTRARWALYCNIRSVTLFDSYVGVIAVLHIIAGAVAAELGKQGRGRLRRIEALHEALEDF